MKRELTIAAILCILGMVISFVPILYKNHWIIHHDGHEIKLFEE